MGRVTLRPTILEDLPVVIGETLPYRIRTITAAIDDRVLGIGGIALPPSGPAIAFVQLAPVSSTPRTRIFARRALFHRSPRRGVIRSRFTVRG